MTEAPRALPGFRQNGLLARLGVALAGLLAALVTAGIVVAGFFIGVTLIGVLLLAVAGFWLWRKLGGRTPRIRIRPTSMRRAPVTIDGEFVVLEPRSRRR